MKRILWISVAVPYDKVDHAGGKSHNYYIKCMKKSNIFDIFLISFYRDYEKNMIDLNQYGINNDLICLKQDFISKLKRGIINIKQELLPFLDDTGGFLMKYRKEHVLSKILLYKQKYGEPETIILQWTQMGLLIKEVKEIFQNSKIICIEEDVAFQGYYRKFLLGNKGFEKWKLKKCYQKLRKSELECLQISDLIIVNNYKDKELLLAENIKNEIIFETIPYFDNYNNVKKVGKEKRIVFYGNMSRAENYESVIWFINHVFMKLDDVDLEFWIVGSSPHKKLMKYQNDRIIITGFIENIDDIFSKAICLVAPLLFGAGIKVKILEAMSAGLPVLTNQIGIEGIKANNGEDFLFCENAEDYIYALQKITTDDNYRQYIGKNARKTICNYYDKESKIDFMIKKIESI